MISKGLMLVKKHSSRLYNKNAKRICGKPMFVWNLEKMVKIFDNVYVSSDDDKILEIVSKIAIPIKRPAELCGDTPNIPVYQHALQFMDKPDIIVAVQANSPNIDEQLIEDAKYLMEYGYRELLTCHEDYSIYGSIWGLRVSHLEHYGNPYEPRPEILLMDPSIDIHTEEDFKKAEKWLTLQ